MKFLSEGACFPFTKYRGNSDFVIRRAQGVNIGAFSGCNGTSLANRLMKLPLKLRI